MIDSSQSKQKREKEKQRINSRCCLVCFSVEDRHLAADGLRTAV
uniref:Uncharacterized protein MANES_13G155200 n=1 Tax=Rhizophora mucronata TaxID=61149 RepID=A0A2P2MSB4_RHIMU